MRRLLPALSIAAFVLAIGLPATIASAEDYWDASTRRAGLAFDYGVSFVTRSGDAADALALNDSGVGFFNLGFGLQVAEPIEFRLEFGLESTGSDVSTSGLNTWTGWMGVRLHLVPGNVYNWRVPNMLDVFVSAHIGAGRIASNFGSFDDYGMEDGLGFRIGGGLRGSFDRRGTAAAGGLYWHATAEYRYLEFDELILDGASTFGSYGMEGLVVAAGIGVLF